MRYTALILLLLSIFSPLAQSQLAPHSKLLKRRVQKRHTIRTVNPMPPGYLTPNVGHITVGVGSNNLLNRFNPDQAFGAGIDAIDIGSYGQGAVRQVYASHNLSAMLTAGQRALTYRLYTELGVQAWHWNSRGAWSDTSNGGEGYFTGDTQSVVKINHSFGFKLPHRGSTYDNASGDGYSRLTDNDKTTYWKSNPYLTSYYTQESDTLHPQWVLINLTKKHSINGIRIHWANPYATDFTVQYWVKNHDNPIDDPTKNGGQWKTFDKGQYSAQTGGEALLKVSSQPLSVQYIRIVMTASSNTYDNHGQGDARNRLGYAVYEVEVGSISSDGAFTDYVSHRPDAKQTPIYVSSTDCWHTVKDQTLGDEQAGLDLALRPSGVGRGLPALVPVAMAYGIPEDAVAEIAYLKKQGYPLTGVELGEEPDGQFMSPEDYGALYVQWAAQLRQLDANLPLGGPVLSTDSVQCFPDNRGESDWLKRFVAYLKTHNGVQYLNFISVEHYPLDPTASWTALYDEPVAVDTIFSWVANAGVPPNTPLLITEANVCAGSSEAVVNVMGAIWYADFIGRFFSDGGRSAYFYRYEGMPLSSDASAPYSNSVMFLADPSTLALTSPPETSRIPVKPTAEYFAAQLIHREWAQAIGKLHEVYPVQCDLMDANGNQLVTAYALLRPDGRWAVLLVNRDESTPHTVSVKFLDTTSHYFKGAVQALSFGVENYAWHPNGADGYADPPGSITRLVQAGGANTTYILPKGSLTVLRGRVH